MPEQPIRQWVLSFPFQLRFIRRFAPHPSGQLKLFNASLLSVRQPPGTDEPGADDPSTSDSSETSTTPIDQNALLFSPVDIEIDESGNRAFILEHDNASIISMDLDSAERTVITGPNHGSGQRIYGNDMAIDLVNHRIFVVVDGHEIYEIDIGTGERAFFTSLYPDGYPNIGRSIDIDHANNQLIVTGISDIVLVDLTTKSVTPLIEDSRYSFEKTQLDESANHLIIASYINGERIESIDLESGEQTWLYEDMNLKYIEDMVIDRQNGRVFVWSESGLYTLNLEAGAKTDLSLDSFNYSGGDFEPIALDNMHNRLIVADRERGNLVSYNLSSGTGGIIALSNVGDGIKIIGGNTLVYDKEANRLLVAEDQLETVYAIDLDTGDRSVFSSKPRDSEVYIDNTRDLALDYANDRLLIADNSFGLVEVGLTTGEWQYFNRVNDPNGITSIELDLANNRLLVSNDQGYQIHQADLTTKTFSSFASDISSFFTHNRVIAINDQTSELVLFNGDNSRVFDLNTATYRQVSFTGEYSTSEASTQIDPSTATLYVLKYFGLYAYPYDGGEATEISGLDTGSGPLFFNGHNMTLDTENQRAFIVDASMDAVFEVDLTNGNRKVVSK